MMASVYWSFGHHPAGAQSFLFIQTSQLARSIAKEGLDFSASRA
jgi:hypothetical protein